VAAFVRNSPRRLHALLARLLSPVANVALVYFVLGCVIFWRGIPAPDLGRIDEQELDFLALAQEGEGGKSYAARYKVAPPGSYDTARIAFGSLDREDGGQHVTALGFEPIGDSARSIERIDAGSQHRAALRFKRVSGATDVAVMVRAKLQSDKPPELIHVAVAAEYGKRDIAWHVIRHFRERH
jgi:hypothetical protein